MWWINTTLHLKRKSENWLLKQIQVKGFNSTIKAKNFQNLDKVQIHYIDCQFINWFACIPCSYPRGSISLLFCLQGRGGNIWNIWRQIRTMEVIWSMRRADNEMVRTCCWGQAGWQEKLTQFFIHMMLLWNDVLSAILDMNFGVCTNATYCGNAQHGTQHVQHGTQMNLHRFAHYLLNDSSKYLWHLKID